MKSTFLKLKLQELVNNILKYLEKTSIFKMHLKEKYQEERFEIIKRLVFNRLIDLFCKLISATSLLCSLTDDYQSAHWFHLVSNSHWVQL